MHNAHCTSTFDVRRKVSHINRGKDIIFICSSSSHIGVHIYVHFDFCYFRTCEDGFSYSYSSHYTTVPNMQVSNDSGNYDDDDDGDDVDGDDDVDDDDDGDDVDDVDDDVDPSTSADDDNGDLCISDPHM